MSPALLLAAAWFTLAPLLTPRQEIAVATVDGKVYAIGGLSGQSTLSSVEEYDPATNRWRFVAPLPQPVHHPAAAVVDGFLYVIGGYRSVSFDATTDVYRFHPAANQWTAVASLPSARAALAAATINGKIYAVGGAPTLRELLEYDPASNQWTARASMPTPREHLAAAAYAGRLYVAGGRAAGNTGAFEVYDPLTNRWTQLPPLTPRSGLAAAVIGDRMYVVGGEGNPAAISGVFPHNESFDFIGGAWRRETDMPTPRHGMGAVTIGSVMYVPAGATIAGFGTVATHEAFGNLSGRRRAVRRGA